GQAPRFESRQDTHQDSSASNFLWRRTAVAKCVEGSGGPGGMARIIGDDLSHRSWAGEGAPGGEVQLGYQATLRCHCQNSGLDLSERVDRSWKLSRWVGQWRRRS